MVELEDAWDFISMRELSKKRLSKCGDCRGDIR
jgi:hypothetical protein